MSESEPLLCHPDAFYLFSRQLRHLETTEGLLYAALAISMHALDDVDPCRIDQRLQALAERVNQRVRSRQTPAILAHLHQVLFEEEGFTGNQNSYYYPINSYVPAVLQTKKGIPITLALIYKVVGQRAGLQVQGLNTPGHFLAQVTDNRKNMIVDPFYGGQILSREEALTRIEQIIGRPVAHHDRYFEPATHRQWLARMLANLQHIFAASHRYTDLAAMTELQSLLADG